MSFSEFLQWIRNFFNSRSAPGSSSGARGATTTGSTGVSVKPVSTSSPANQPASSTTNGSSTSSEVSTPPTAPTESATAGVGATTPPPLPTSPATEIATPPPLPEATQPEAVTPPPLPETVTPAVPTAPTAPVISQPQHRPPVIAQITTADAKVALNQETTFQIVTNPADQYADCSIDLSNASNASIVQGIDPITGQFSLSFDKASSSDNETQLIKVKNPQGESSIAVTVSLMKLFWHNHPGRKNVCDETLFVNQCAIRMSTALELSGIKLSQDRRVMRRCTTEYRAFKHHKDGLVKGHVLAAQELANWIKSQRSTFGRRSIVNSQEEILGRSGIIFFRDGWGTTDHIDVWDGQALVGGFPSYFDSDFKELWFWDVY